MREIKFRAWSKHKNLMGEVTGFRFSKSQYPFVNVRFKENGKIVDEGYHFGQEDGCDNVILMQFTGRHDKNGREIYEGDIVTNGVSVGVVIWHDVRAMFIIDCSQHDIAPMDDWCELKRIGTIYENPELLE